MGTKVKRLLRTLRYFSRIFDEKEPEMQIGHPTDVKHVAHIGWDGPDASRPSWMNEFKAPSEISAVPLNSAEQVNLSTRLPSEDTSSRGKKKYRPRHLSTGSGLPPDSPSRKGSGTPKHSRRHRSLNSSLDSPARDPSGSTRSSTRHPSARQGTDSPLPDLPSIPKHSRGKKSKGSSKKSRSKEQNLSSEAFPFADQGSEGSQPVHGRKNTANHLTSVLEAYGEG